MARQAGLLSSEVTRMSLRIAVLVAAILLATTAVAEPDAFQKLHRWLWPNAPRQELVVIQPLPDLPPVSSVAPAPAQESPAAIPRPRPRVVERQPKAKTVLRQESKDKPNPMDDSPVECWKVQWGASMSCDVIRANEHIYEGYSHRRKCASEACLTPTQIAGIQSCFPKKKPRLRCP